MIKFIIRLILILVFFAFGVIAGYLGWFNWLLDNFNWIKK